MVLADAVKKETGFIAAGCAAGSVIVVILFFVLHGIVPEYVPFDYKVILGALGGFLVATGNFFWMAVTVQKVASMENEDAARGSLLLSYRYRTMAQLLWVILAIVLPFFNAVAGIVPLFIPSRLIKARGIIDSFKKK